MTPECHQNKSTPRNDTIRIMVVDSLLYVYSCDVNRNVQIKIGGLDGKFEKPSYELLAEDESMEYCVAMASHDEPDLVKDMYISCQVYCCGIAVGPSMKTSYKCLTKRLAWNEWITLPVKYNELSRDALLTISVHDLHDNPKPHTIASTTLPLFSKRSVFRQGIHDLKMWPFVSPDHNIPSKTPAKVKGENDVWKDESEMRRLGKLSKKHRSGHMDTVDWLDRMTFREIEHVNERHKRKSNCLFLLVHFPRIHFNQEEYVIVYYEEGVPDLVNYVCTPKYVPFPDLDIGKPNVIEEKYNMITRSVESDTTARQHKPNAAQKQILHHILKMPPSSNLSGQQKTLIWKFRYYLSSDNKALSKFVKSVEWSVVKQANHAEQLMKEWAPMDVEDALEFLSPQFEHVHVRRYAVSRLRTASPQYLLLFLLQLVQALKFEETCTNLIDKSVDDSDGGSTIADAIVNEQENDNENSDLASFLIESACEDANLANFLYWYLKVETESENVETQNKYEQILERLMLALSGHSSTSRKAKAQLELQNYFVDTLITIMRAVESHGGYRQKKIEYLKTQLEATQQPGSFCNMRALKGLPLPLNPSVHVDSVISEHVSLFNSARMPAKLDFKVHNTDKTYTTIFKHGDDLRQDQLVLQIIQLMDNILRSENLDMKLQPYKVLATGADSGFVEFVSLCTPLRDVVRDWKTVQDFFRFYRPCSVNDIEPACMDNFVRSCAAYSVICYILGIGDRHQHNLMLCQNGKLFHIDFGYFLGRDPKPMPPPMKITGDMIAAMGGTDCEHWHKFRGLCYTVFQTLRRHANMILNLFSLMVNSGIPDIALEPDKAVRKVEERFHLDLSDEQLMLLVHNLIDRSTNAKIAAVVDIAHDFATYFRA